MVKRKSLRILAIETSCDETAIAILELTGPKRTPVIKILSNIVSSQVKLHAEFGGVVPNLAKREHQRNLPIVLKRALSEGKLLKIPKSKFLTSQQIAKSKLQNIKEILLREPELGRIFPKNILPLAPPEIDAIAVTYGPGLAPALWVGVNFAKTLAYLWKKPLIPVNHMAGHLYSSLLKQITNDKLQITKIKLPALALLVSGGHTELILMRNYGKYKIVGETLDDAAGEAFDKVARILELGYPGGPEIARLAQSAQKDAEQVRNNAESFQRKSARELKLPRPMLNSKNFNFSFSGLKTAVLYLVRDLKKKYSSAALRPAMAREFQEAVVEVLIEKTVRAAKKFKVKTVLLGGGVAANKLLRKNLSKKVTKELPSATCYLPLAQFTGDNALIIALAAYFSGKKKAWSKVRAEANIKLG